MPSTSNQLYEADFMTKPKPREVDIRTQEQAIFSIEPTVPEDELRRLCGSYFPAEDQKQAFVDIRQAYWEFRDSLKLKKLVPSVTMETDDLKQIMDAIAGLRERLQRYPPTAEVNAFMVARGEGTEWFDLKGDLVIR